MHPVSGPRGGERCCPHDSASLWADPSHLRSQGAGREVSHGAGNVFSEQRPGLLPLPILVGMATAQALHILCTFTAQAVSDWGIPASSTKLGLQNPKGALSPAAPPCTCHQANADACHQLSLQRFPPASLRSGRAA